MEWYLMVWKKYAEFNGRSRRKEYWMFTLIHLLIFLALEICGIALMKSGIGTVLIGICGVYALAALIPALACCVRRLHDTGKSGWFVLLSFIPLVGFILIVFLAIDGDSGPNVYGPSPKAA
jgi:uncharacterized membrane protein YhaH (DUF805 family)